MNPIISKRVKAKLAATKGAATTEAPPPCDVDKPTPPTGSPPERVLHTCGHVCNNRACPACRAVANAKKAARRAEKREAAANSRADAHRPPDGARFDVVYDATCKTWTGKLSIGTTVFEGNASGVFRLLQSLDKAYRDSVASAGADQPPAPQ